MQRSTNPLSRPTNHPDPRRHSTEGFDDHSCQRRRRQRPTGSHRSQEDIEDDENMMVTQQMMDNSTGSQFGADLSLSDLPPTKPSRSKSGVALKKKSYATMDCSSQSNNNAMENDLSLSCRTATTIPIEDSSSSLLLMGSSSVVVNSSSQRRSCHSEPTTLNSSNSTCGMMSDESGMSNDCSNNSSSRRRIRRQQRRELRNLKGIQRRRSDPVTRRWREQCSKLYKEHVLLEEDTPTYPVGTVSSASCPELPLAQHEQPQQQPLPPLLVSPPLESSAETIDAARKIQSVIRRYLLRSTTTTTSAEYNIEA